MTDRLAYFPADYEFSRTRFRSAVAALTRTKQSGSWTIPSRMDADLTVDYVYLPPTGQAQRLFVIVSGTHGPECPLGSAIQQLFFQEILPLMGLDSVGILIVHALNPYGFKYYHRHTENGVNLNRNCSLHPDLFRIRNPAALEMSRRFVANEPVSNMRTFIVDSSRIRNHTVYLTDDVSVEQFIKAVGPGQYEDRRALEFGGFGPEPQIQYLASKLKEIAPSFRDLVELDLHTGLGHPGRLHLLSDAGKSVNSSLFYELFDPKNEQHLYEFTPSEAEGFYPTHGSTNNLFGELVTDGQRACALTMEFGTFGMESDATIVGYNQWLLDQQGLNCGFANDQVRLELENLRRERFAPTSAEWRRQTLDCTALLFQKLFLS